MKRISKYVLSAVLGIGTVATAIVSHAAPINVSIWENVPISAGNADIVPAGLPDAKTTVSAINYDSNVTGFTFSTFLTGNTGFTNTSAQWTALGGSNGLLTNTFMQFTGQTFLNAGVNSFVVPHDDGLKLDIAGIGTVVDQPGPTAPVLTPFNVNAPSAGLYSFTLNYGECCTPPAVLGFTVNGVPVGTVPEPSALILLGSGIAGLAAWRKYRA
jgi:PEP-CTERM motif